MKNIVISAPNLYEGGPLTVYKDCLNTLLEKEMQNTYNIVAFVHKKNLFKEYENKIEIIELPKSRKNYIYRFWYEYIYFYLYSRKREIHVWFSLHDMTPNVKAKKRYVYCHNASPFLKTSITNLKYSWKTFLFAIFYKYIYKINIKKNNAVIVQQDWIRKEFIKMFQTNNVIVAKPFALTKKLHLKDKENVEDRLYSFIYAAYPRFFKNFEVIGEACKILEREGINNYEVLFTIDGNENKYSSEIKRKYGAISNIKFIGLQKREELFDIYNNVDSMIFPSKLETWGLPISEFKQTGKPLVVVDLPYAKETVDAYHKVSFFDSNQPVELAEIMKKEIKKTNEYRNFVNKEIKQPVVNNWFELFEHILN